jgi:hypothetical protein
MAITPSKNLNMAGTNPKDENFTKQSRSLKRLKLAPRGRGPSQHEHIPLFALGLDSNENNGGFKWEENDEGSSGRAPSK